MNRKTHSNTTVPNSRFTPFFKPCFTTRKTAAAKTANATSHLQSIFVPFSRTHIMKKISRCFTISPKFGFLISFSFVSAFTFPVRATASHSAQQNKTPSGIATPSRENTTSLMDRGVTSGDRSGTFKDQVCTVAPFVSSGLTAPVHSCYNVMGTGA